MCRGLIGAVAPVDRRPAAVLGGNRRRKPATCATRSPPPAARLLSFLRVLTATARSRPSICGASAICRSSRHRRRRRSRATRQRCAPLASPDVGDDKRRSHLAAASSPPSPPSPPPPSPLAVVAAAAHTRAHARLLTWARGSTAARVSHPRVRRVGDYETLRSLVGGLRRARALSERTSGRCSSSSSSSSWTRARL